MNGLEQSQGRVSSPKVVLRRVTQVPSIKDNVISDLCIEYFGLKPGRIERLNGYDDKNYHLTESTCLFTNPNLAILCSDGYVLKITNVEDTFDGLVEGQNALLLHLTKKGLPVQALVKSKSGDHLVRIRLDYDHNGEKNGGIHAIRLLHFIPGHRLYHVPYTANIVYKVGLLLARVHDALQDFGHIIFGDAPSTPWSLFNFLYVQELLDITVEDFGRKQIVLQVVEAFKQIVIPKMKKLRIGQIHGDFNEQNLLVRRTAGRGDDDDEQQQDVCGILDFGDSHRTCLAFDIAVGIMYMMIIEQCSIPIADVGGHFLAGYTAEGCLPEDELCVLRICICARYCQSLVYGLYSYKQNPTIDNGYVLITQKKGWPQLIELWNTPDDQLYDNWRRVLNDYSITRTGG